MTDICIEINENARGIISQFNEMIDYDDNINLKIIFNGEGSNMDKIENKLHKINLLELLNFNFCKIKSLSLISNEKDISIGIIEIISILLSFMPYNIEKINIDLSDIDIPSSDYSYLDIINDYDCRLSHFFSKQKKSCKKITLSMNYLFSKSIREFENYTKLEKIELNLYTVGNEIGKTLNKIIRNNDNLNTISFNLIGINNDESDLSFWFISLCEAINDHENIKNISIIWKIENINDELYEDTNLIFQKLLNKYHIIESIRKLLNKNNVEHLYLNIYTPFKELNKLFDNIFYEINSKIKHKRKYNRIN